MEHSHSTGMALKLMSLLAVLVLASDCRHPFEEGMMGAFPVFELLSAETVTFPASGTKSELSGEIEVRTNSEISVTVDYESGGRSWIRDTDIRQEESTGISYISFSVSENSDEDARTADIVISSDLIGSSASVRVRQNGNASSDDPDSDHDPDDYPEGSIYYGDFYLETQDDVDDFTYSGYSGIEGRLVIGETIPYGSPSHADPSLAFFESGISDLSGLDPLEYVSDGIIMVGNVRLADISVLNDVDTPLIEITRMSPHAFQTYAGNARDMYICECPEVIDDFSGLSDCGRLENLILEGNHITSIESLASVSGLRSLEIRNDAELRNINVLAEMPFLESVVLENLSVSVPQVNYIRTVRPELSLALVAPDVDISLEVNVPLSTMTMNSADLIMTVTDYGGISFHDAGYVISENGSEFDFSGRISFGTVPSDTEFTYTLSGLAEDTSYDVWMYAIDENESIYLSAYVRFRTPGEGQYRLILEPDFPYYANTGGYEPATTLEACVFKRLDFDSVTSDHYPATEENGKWLVDNIEPGFRQILITNNGFSGFSHSYDDVIWYIRQDGAADLGHDLQIGTLELDFSGYDTRNVDIIRPVLRLEVNLTVEGNFDVTDIADVSMRINGCYEECAISTHTGEVTYEGNISNIIHSSDWNDRTVSFGNIYIFPVADGNPARLDFGFTLEDGTELSASYDMEYALEANNDYTGENALNLTMNLNMSDTGVGFTVEDIEEVEDVIEF